MKNKRIELSYDVDQVNYLFTKLNTRSGSVLHPHFIQLPCSNPTIYISHAEDPQIDAPQSGTFLRHHTSPLRVTDSGACDDDALGKHLMYAIDAETGRACIVSPFSDCGGIYYSPHAWRMQGLEPGGHFLTLRKRLLERAKIDDEPLFEINGEGRGSK